MNRIVGVSILAMATRLILFPFVVSTSKSEIIAIACSAANI